MTQLSVQTALPGHEPYKAAENPVKTPLAAFLEASRPLAFNINFARITGDAKAALFLSQLVYWTRKGADVLDTAGWVFKNGQQLEQELGLGRHEQASARKRLVDLGLIEERRMGVPARTCYRVVPQTLGVYLAQLIRAEPVQWSLLDVRSDTQDIKTLLGRQFAYHRILMRITNTCTSAIYLSKALAIQRRFIDRPDVTDRLTWDTDWFRMAADATQAETGLSIAQQREAKQKLCQLGVIHEAMMTHPRRQAFIRINLLKLNELLLAEPTTLACENRQTGDRATEALNGSDNPNCAISANRVAATQLANVAHLAQKPPKTDVLAQNPVAVCENRQTGDQATEALNGSDNPNCAISANWIAATQLANVTHSTQKPPKNDVLAQNPVAVCENRQTGDRATQALNGFDNPNCAISANRVAATQLANMTHSTQKPPKNDVLAQNPVAACENRHSPRPPVCRFSHSSLPVLARATADFHTLSLPVFTHLHAGATRARQDYKEDYINTNTTTTTSQPTSQSQPATNPVRTNSPIATPETTVAAQPPQVVVVSLENSLENKSEKDVSPTRGEDLIWPKSLTADECSMGEKLLTPLVKTGKLEDAQCLVDELAGSIEAGSVKTPLAYLRRLIDVHRTTPGGLVFEKALLVRQRRANEQALAIKLAAATGHRNDQKNASEPSQDKVADPAVIAEAKAKLALLRAQIKSGKA